MSKVFIDTNVFYNILFETSLTRVARKLLEDYEESMFYTSLTVVNELLYISTRKYYQTEGGVGGPYSLRKLIASKGYPKPIVNGIRKLLRDPKWHYGIGTILTFDEDFKRVPRLKVVP